MDSDERAAMISKIMMESKFLSKAEHHQIATRIAHGEGIEDRIREVKKSGNKYATVGPMTDYDGGIEIELAQVSDAVLQQILGFIDSRQT